MTSFRELFKLKLKLKESWMFLDLVEAISCIIIDLLVTKGAKFLHSFDAHGFSFFIFNYWAYTENFTVFFVETWF